MTKELKILQNLLAKNHISKQEYYKAVIQIAGDDLRVDFYKNTVLYHINKRTAILVENHELYITDSESLPVNIDECENYDWINWHNLSDNEQNKTECEEFARSFPIPLYKCDERWEARLNNLLKNYQQIHILDHFRPGIVKEDTLEWAAFIANVYVDRDKLERKGRYDKYFVFDNLPSHLKNTPFINWRWIKNVYLHLVDFANKLAEQDNKIIKQNAEFTCSIRDVEKYAWNLQQKLYHKEDNWDIADDNYRKGAIMALELVLEYLEKYDTISDDTYDY